MQISFKTKGESRGFVVIEEIASVCEDKYNLKLIFTLKSGKEVIWAYPDNHSMEEDYDSLIDIVIPDEDV